MYDIRVNKGDSPVIIHGWEIPKNAVYNADPVEPFVCLCPSPWSFDEYIWRYTEKRWQHDVAPMRIRKPLLDFIITNHLDCFSVIEGEPPKPSGKLPSESYNSRYNIKINKGDSPVIIHGWEIPKNAVYSDNSKESFVCLFPSQSAYKSHIWRYVKGSSGCGWQRNTAPMRTKEAILNFIVANHLECSHVIEGTPPETELLKSEPEQQKGRKQTLTKGKTRKKKSHKKNPAPKKNASYEEEGPKTCIICGQPTFMGTLYCYNCYCQYVEKPRT